MGDLEESATNQVSDDAEVERGLDVEGELKTCCAECWGSLTRRDLKHFDKFVNTTATHGIRRIFTGKSKCRRLFWLLLFLAMSAWCLNNIGRQIAFLANSPTSTTIRFGRVDRHDFPAVTICNNAPFNYSAILELYGQNVAEFLGCVAKLFSARDSDLSSNVTRFVNTCKSNHSLNPQQLNLSIAEIFWQSLSDPHQFILECHYNGDPRAGKCSYRNFTQVATNNGICYTFNGNFPVTCSDTVQTQPLVTTGAGQRFALTVELNIDQDSYPPFVPDAGVLLEIHSAVVPPRPLQRGTAVPPGQTAHIGLTSSTYTFRNCPVTPPTLDFYSRYNIPNCVLNNLFTRVARDCGCLPLAAPSPCPGSELKGTPNCTLDQIACYLDKFSDPERGGTDDDCRQECNTEVYSSRISYSKYPAKNFQNASLSDSMSPEENLVILNVYFEDLVVQNVVEESAYDITRLLGDIGGQLGLFLGVSVLSVTEFLMWILDEAKDRLLCCKDWRQMVICKTYQTKTHKDVELQAVEQNSSGPPKAEDESNCTT